MVLKAMILRSHVHSQYNIHIYIKTLFGVSDLARSFFLSRPKYGIRGAGILGRT